MVKLAKTKKQEGRATKHLNKRLNKLVRKKGKLNVRTRLELQQIQGAKKSGKRQHQDDVKNDWLNAAHTKRAETDYLEDVLPIDMIDSDCDLDIPESILKRNINKAQSSSKSLKVEKEDDFDTKRSFSGKSGLEYSAEHVKALLPVKGTDGTILPRVMQLSEEEYQKEMDDLDDDEDEKDELPTADLEQPEKQQIDYSQLSAVQLLAKKQELLEEHKVKIANICQTIIQFPEEQVGKLKVLLNLAEGDCNFLVRAKVQRLAILSLLEVFVDIIPGYKIRQRTELEQNQQVRLKKETKKLVDFEEGLLRNYQKYLRLLEKKIKKTTDKTATVGSQKSSLALLCTKCFCRLLVVHSHFNFRANILVAIGEVASQGCAKSRRLCCEALGEILRSDKLGDASLDAVKMVARLVKERPKNVHPDLLAVFLHLRIKTIEKKDHVLQAKRKKLNKKKYQLNEVSKKEQKYKKQLEKLGKELRETEAEQNKNVQLQLHTEIMNQVFVTYFRVLRRLSTSTLLSPVLEGLSKFAHLINIDFYDDLLSSLRELVESGKLKALESLHCIHTVFVILSGEGKALNIDPHRFYRSLYALLPTIVTESKEELRNKQFVLCLKCLDLMLVQRRKQVSLDRVAAFAKRLCLLSLLMPSPKLKATLICVRSIFLAHPQLERMLGGDEETGGGGARFSPQIDDPDHAHALSAMLVPQLTLMQSHKDPTIKTLATHILKGLPSAGPHRLPIPLTQTNSWDGFDEFQRLDSDSERIIPYSKALKQLKNGLLCKEIEAISNRQLEAH